MNPITFPRFEQPLVSIVMVTYGAWFWVEKALRALVSSTQLTYELILVDNASPDGTGANLQGLVEGAELIINLENLGFGAGSNLGARRARGRYLCFLNSDAIVRPGWLEPLVAVLESDPTVGAVLPRILNLDGSLQDAGGIVGSDGYTRVWGEGGDPDGPEYNFPRQIDYGTGACLVTRKSVFDELGGFEPLYGIGYYEDVDYCFALRARGLETVYEPRAVIAHVRSASSSREEAVELVERNRILFLSRWGAEVAGRPSLREASRRRILVCRDALATETILVVDPNPSRASDLVGSLARMWPRSRVTCLTETPGDAGWSDRLREVEILPFPVAPEEWFADRLLHYSWVVACETQCLERFAGALRETQPQATVITGSAADILEALRESAGP